VRQSPFSRHDFVSPFEIERLRDRNHELESPLVVTDRGTRQRFLFSEYDQGDSGTLAASDQGATRYFDIFPARNLEDPAIWHSGHVSHRGELLERAESVPSDLTRWHPQLDESGTALRSDHQLRPLSAWNREPLG
jgi:hypothetical protein